MGHLRFHGTSLLNGIGKSVSEIQPWALPQLFRAMRGDHKLSYFWSSICKHRIYLDNITFFLQKSLNWKLPMLIIHLLGDNVYTHVSHQRAYRALSAGHSTIPSKQVVFPMEQTSVLVLHSGNSNFWQSQSISIIWVVSRVTIVTSSSKL